ncbi:xanthine dehydrogenase-like isoform X2 [Homalodisca vitripennis]|uniref:xanthine dehydrogenase-like isoform X2 n=1 Tax=Homalodisca vitripennis TaxID=197043 RepID=UPI001EEC0E07|nr:xanthine dehydrogenase-like isoform X2 [Homalodisca vitripennis]
MDSAVQCWDSFVSFTLNGEIQKVSSLPGDTSLNTYIREYAKLKGTKFMCREGGCGACVVSLQFTHPATGQQRVVSVNSCTFPVYACQGLKVTTVEGIGSKAKGYHEIQSRLAHFYGTQCGYCSPGWVMGMYSLLKSNPEVTMKEIEDSFTGNICRCTGYRPILDAFKSFASDRSSELEKKVADIEDLLKVCPKSGIVCHGKCKNDKNQRSPFDCVDKNHKDDCDIEFLEVALALPSLRLELRGGSQWYKVSQVDELFEIFGMVNGSYNLVAGNTAKGIVKDKPPPDVFIDINGVGFLKAHSFHSNNLYVGANTTLSDVIVLFEALAEEKPEYFSYLKQLADHIEKVANRHVRNVGTIAGNLMIKHESRYFQSDIFVILETVGANVSVRGDNEAITLMSLPAFLETDMYKKVILQIVLPPLNANCYVVKTFKIGPRVRNAVAYVNAGFRFCVKKEDGFRVEEHPSIVFGGINPSFIHADLTENYLHGKRLLDVSTLQAALGILSKEVQPDHKLPDATPQFRKGLTLALLYRVVLSLSPNSVKAQFRSGGEDITRPLSSGKQEFDTDSSRPPLYQPFPKLESLIQASGEAEYVYDMPTVGNDLYAAFVITKQGPATLVSLDPSKALKIPGVVAFFSAKDIPGENTFTPSQDLIPDKEKLFVDKDILFAGHQVGVLVAKTQELADFAAEHVIIRYKDKKKPVLDVREVVKNKDTSRMVLRDEIPPIVPTPSVSKVIKGEFKMDTQYHFMMETLACVTIPTEDGLDVYCTTQWPQTAQEAIALVLNIPENNINMKLRRLGGSFGGKLTRANIVGGACSLAAYLLQRPVRMVVKLETMMEAIGKRYPCYFDYEAGVNSEGAIQYLNTNVYDDAGSAFNDPVIDLFLFPSFMNVYDSKSWGTKMYDVKTDKPCNIWTRSPGTLEGITLAEHIMEHIAHELGKDPLSVRMQNLNKLYPTEALIKLVKEKSDYETRKAANNVWKKRGISLVPMSFPLDTLSNFHAVVSVYRNDGSVAITHGGVEMGQGVNTKAAQVCASALGIPLEQVSVKPIYSITAPNNGPSGGSYTSESICLAVDECCRKLNKRLEPIRKALVNPTWPALIQAAYAAQVNLNASYMFSTIKDKKEYKILGATVIEVEIDILTGEHKIIRVDILEDTGKSLNPFLDIGQVEGGFVMGLGYWTSEEMVYDPDTGRMLSNRTLKYKVPCVKDIPVDFRVYLLKNSDNPLGILRSKAVGEPPLVMSNSVLFAIRQALRSARKDVGLPDQWLSMDAPFTGEKIFLSSGIDTDKYLL